MSIKLTKQTCFEKWIVYKGPNWAKNWPYYIGPKSGRLIVVGYKTKAEAEAALEMKNWLIKFLDIKTRRN